MRCNYCEWRCELDRERYGVCRMYYAEGGEVRERFPNRWSTYAMSRVESLPFYHAYPGSRVRPSAPAGATFPAATAPTAISRAATRPSRSKPCMS